MERRNLGSSGFETREPGTGPSAANASNSEVNASASAAYSESRATRFTSLTGAAGRRSALVSTSTTYPAVNTAPPCSTMVHHH